MLDAIATTRLSNGLKVICLIKESAPVVSVQVWYRVGSVNERDGVRGLSHLLEHMMFRGSRNFKPEEHTRRISMVGGHCNAFTTEDATVFLDSVPTSHLSMALELEADRMTGLTLDKDIFETERNVIIEEYHSYMNVPTAKAFLDFRREFFSTHPYALSPLGLLEDIQSVTVGQCREYYHTWYTPDNAVIVVVGDVDSAQQVFDLTESHFGSLRPAEGRKVEPAPVAIPGWGREPFRMKRRIEFDVPILLMGYPAPAAPDESATHLEILQTIISQGDSSRLHKEIVRKKSLAIATGGMNHCLRLSGMTLFFAVFTPDTPVQRLEEAIERQLRIVRDDGVSFEEIEKVRNGSLTNRTFELYSAEHISQRIGFSEVIEGDYRLWVNRLKTLENVNRDALTQAARTFWTETSRSTLVLRPKRVNPFLFSIGIGRRLLSLLRFT